MGEPIWNQFLTERDKAVFAAAGYGARAGFGNRPALLVIDVNYNFCGDRREPILESITRWRNSCGVEAWDGVARIKELIDVAHAQGVPVIYTTGVRRADNWDSGSWSWKNTRTGERPLVHHRNAVAHPQHLFHVARDHQDRDAPVREAAHQLVDLRLRADVDPARRLVEDQHLRLQRQPAPQHHLLLVAPAQVRNPGFHGRRLDP